MLVLLNSQSMYVLIQVHALKEHLTFEDGLCLTIHFYLASSFYVEVLVPTFGNPNDKGLKTEHSWQIYSLHQ